MAVAIEAIVAGRYPFRGHPLLGTRAGLAAGFARAHLAEVTGTVGRLAPHLAGLADDEPFGILDALAGLDRRLRTRERGREEELSRLAVRTVAEAYGIPPGEMQGLVASANLSDSDIPLDFEAPPRPPAVPPGLQPWIDRRITHNALIQGNAIEHMLKALELARTDLDAAWPGATDEYRLFAALAQLSQFLFPAPGRESPPGVVAGLQRVTWKDGTPKIEAQAVIFPVLVQEVSKGVMETVMAHGLPRPGQLSDSELDALDYAADHPSDEAWHFVLGPGFSAAVRDRFTRGGVWRPGDPPGSPLRDALQTWMLLSLLPAEDLHAGLGCLMGASTPGEEADAARAMADLLDRP